MKTVVRFLVAILFAGASLHAWADTRSIPDAAKLIKVSPYTSRSLIVNGKEVMLTAGARIHSTENRTIVPTRVPNNAAARAIFERNGAMSEVWILTAAEYAAAK